MTRLLSDNPWVIPTIPLAVIVATIATLMTVGFVFGASPQAPPAQTLFTIQQLKAELDNDPLAVGYATMSNFEAANALNTIGLTGETVAVASVTPTDLQSAVIATEYLALIEAERDLWQALLSVERVEVRNQNIRDQVTSIWAPGTTTLINLSALQTRSASRAEALWGDGAVVTQNQVEEARLLP